MNNSNFAIKLKYRFYPTKEQRLQISKTVGCCRKVYNLLLDLSKKQYEQYLKDKEVNPHAKKQGVSGYDLAYKILSLKADPEYAYLNEVSAVALQQVAIDLGKAYTKFSSSFLANRKGIAGFPKFKSFKHGGSYRLVGASFKYENDKLIIAKCKDPLKIRNFKSLPSEPTSVTITKTATGKYFVSFTCTHEPAKTNGTKVIGVDLGLKDMIVTSEGVRVKPPKSYRRYQAILRRRQQALSRKQKGSNNRNKARIHVAKVHERIANIRNDFQHKLTRQLVDTCALIGIETLSPKNMVKNHKLAKSLHDAAFGGFIDKLLYKVAWSSHCTVVRQPLFYPSSHICNETHLKIERKLKLHERSFECCHCGKTHDRDENAALNLEHEARACVDHLIKLDAFKPGMVYKTKPLLTI